MAAMADEKKTDDGKATATAKGKAAAAETEAPAGEVVYTTDPAAKERIEDAGTHYTGDTL